MDFDPIVVAGIVVQVIGAFSILATVTPNKADDKVVQFFLDFVNALAANIGRAKNK